MASESSVAARMPPPVRYVPPDPPAGPAWVSLGDTLALWPDAALLVDAMGVVRLANQAAVALFGNDQLPGCSVEQLMPAQYRSRHRSLREQFNAGSASRRMDTGKAPLVILGAGGQETPVEISIGSLQLACSGEALQLVTLVDCSQRVAQARAIQRLNEALEARVQARTADLLVARAEAEAANAVKTRFMMNASHEMRTPLTGMLGAAQLGLMRLANGDTANTAELLDKVVRMGHRLRELIESVLHLAEDAWSAHARIPPETLVPVELAVLLEQVLAAKADEALSRQQRLLLELPPGGAPLVRSEPQLLTQVIGYVLDNALRYSPVGSRVIVRVGEEAPAADQGIADAAWIEVLDEGCGIPEAELEAIFEPFYQSSRTWDGAGGTGLGLPLCRSLIARLGGRLSARNRPEGGAVFRLRLPVFRCED